jgi:hypothetical protein
MEGMLNPEDLVFVFAAEIEGYEQPSKNRHKCLLISFQEGTEAQNNGLCQCVFMALQPLQKCSPLDFEIAKESLLSGKGLVA